VHKGGGLRLISFGYLHLGGQSPPGADHVEDVRGRLDDPAGYRQVLAMLEIGPVDGRQDRVKRIVLATPGAAEVLDELAAFAGAGAAVIAIGCAQGHDRSVALAELLAGRVQAAGRAVEVEHWHVDLPRVR
jgi:UPF0042 nucleotide-binding protein